MQGPHHAAQKSTTTGRSDLRTRSSKFASVAILISAIWEPISFLVRLARDVLDETIGLEDTRVGEAVDRWCCPHDAWSRDRRSAARRDAGSCWGPGSRPVRSGRSPTARRWQAIRGRTGAWGPTAHGRPLRSAFGRAPPRPAGDPTSRASYQRLRKHASSLTWTAPARSADLIVEVVGRIGAARCPERAAATEPLQVALGQAVEHGPGARARLAVELTVDSTTNEPDRPPIDAVNRQIPTKWAVPSPR